MIGLALALNTPAASADNIGPVYYPAPDVVENPDGNLAYPRAVLCHGLVDGLCD